MDRIHNNMTGDGQIDFDEFQTMMKKHHVKEADELKQAFDVFDKDGQNKKAKRIWDENTKLGIKYKGFFVRSRASCRWIRPSLSSFISCLCIVVDATFR